MIKRLAIFAALTFVGSCAAATGPAADIVLLHGKVYTVNAKQPWAESVAIRADKIVFVGSDADVKRFIGAKTKIIDAHGRMVLPGFIDSHIHFIEGSLGLSRLSLDDTKNVAEIQKAVREYAAAHANDTWIMGRGWSYPEFPTGMPDKKYLDDVVPD